jgi:hypothetical protein
MLLLLVEILIEYCFTSNLCTGTAAVYRCEILFVKVRYYNHVRRHTHSHRHLVFLFLLILCLPTKKKPLNQLRKENLQVEKFRSVRRDTATIPTLLCTTLPT